MLESFVPFHKQTTPTFCLAGCPEYSNCMYNTTCLFHYNYKPWVIKFAIRFTFLAVVRELRPQCPQQIQQNRFLATISLLKQTENHGVHLCTLWGLVGLQKVDPKELRQQVFSYSRHHLCDDLFVQEVVICGKSNNNISDNDCIKLYFICISDISFVLYIYFSMPLKLNQMNYPNLRVVCLIMRQLFCQLAYKINSQVCLIDLCYHLRSTQSSNGKQSGTKITAMVHNTNN